MCVSHREGAVPAVAARRVLGSVGEGGRERERERERERVTAAVYTCFASPQIGEKLEQSDGRTEVGFA